MKIHSNSFKWDLKGCAVHICDMMHPISHKTVYEYRLLLSKIDFQTFFQLNCNKIYQS